MTWGKLHVSSACPSHITASHGPQPASPSCLACFLDLLTCRHAHEASDICRAHLPVWPLWQAVRLLLLWKSPCLLPKQCLVCLLELLAVRHAHETGGICRAHLSSRPLGQAVRLLLLRQLPVPLPWRALYLVAPLPHPMICTESHQVLLAK